LNDSSPSRDNNPWYLLALLVGVYLSLSIDKMVISVVAEPMKREFGLSDAQLGVISGLAYTVPFGLAIMPMGWLVDRYNRRNLLIVNLSIWSGLTALCAFASSYAMLLLTRIGVGASEAAAQPVSMSIIADTFGPRRRATAVSIYAAGAPAGNIVTFLLGAWILAHFDWRMVFLIAGIPGIGIALVLLATTREPSRGAFDGAAASGAAKRSLVQDALTLIRIRPLVHAATANMITVSVQFTLVVWLVSFLVRIHGFSVSEAALLVGIGTGVIQTIGSLAVGPLADRFSGGVASRLALIPAMGAMGVCVSGVVLVLAPSASVAIGAMMVLALIAGFTLGPSYALILSLAPVEIRGSTIALAKLLTIAVGNTILTFATGALSDAIGGSDSIRWALLATVVLNMWAAFHFLRSRSHARTRGL
jgi:predicted MFS family arabinose efflux permease